MQDGDGPLRWDRRRPTVRAADAALLPPGPRGAALAHPGGGGHHEAVSREALGDAPPDALEDERARPDDAPAAVLATISIERPEAPPTRGLVLRPPAARDRAPDGRAGPDGTGPDDDGAAPPDDGDLDLDLSDADPAGAAADGPPPGGPRPPAGPGPGRSRVVTAAAVVGLLVVGALAGATSARQQGQADLDAAARVVVAAHLDAQGLFGAEAATGEQNGDVVQFVDVSLLGTIGGARTAKITRLRTPVGDFEVYAPVTASDGEPGRSTLLKGQVDCTRANALKSADAINGRVLAGSTAVVRPEGSSRDVEVPVFVPNPDAPLLTFDQRCNPQTYTSPYEGPSYSVGALVAHSDGSLDFVASTGTAQPLRAGPSRLAVVTFDPGTGVYGELLPTKVDGGTATFAIPDTRWTVRTTPPLPLVVDKPTFVRVQYEYACRRIRLSRPPALPPLPDLRLGTAAASGGVNPYLDGWDDAAMASAMTAAAVNACGTDVSPTSPPPGSARRQGPRQQ